MLLLQPAAAWRAISRHRIVPAASVALAALSLVVMTGWWLKSALLVRVHPQLSAMQFNTALLFGVAAIGLAASHRRRLAVSAAAGAFVLALAGTTGLQFLFGWDLGVDRLFWEPYVSAPGWPAGRMARNTCTAFVVAGIVLVSTRFSRVQPVTAGIGGLLLVVLAGFSCVQLVLGGGTLARVGRFGGMGIHTAAGFIAFGLAAIQMASSDRRAAAAALPSWMAVGVPLAVLMTSGLLADTLAAALPPDAARLSAGVSLVLGIVVSALAVYSMRLADGARQQAANSEASAEQARAALTALRESEALFQTLFEQASAGIAEVSPSGRMLRVNERFCAIVGRSQSELLHLTVADITHPDDLGVDAERCRSTLTGTLPKTGWHKRYVRPDGSVVFAHVSLALVRDATGRPPYFVKVIQDITELTRAQESVAENRRRLLSFVENTPAAVAMLDRDLRYVAVSRRWRHDYQLGDQELLGRHHYDVFPEIRNLPEWQAVHQRCLEGAVERCDDDHFVRPDGRDEWIMWEVRPWYDEHNAIGGIIMLTEVVTAKRLAERAVQASEERLKLALDNSRHGLWDWNAATKEILLDGNFLEILRYAPHDRPSMTEVWKQSVHPDDLPRVMEVLDRHVVHGELYDVDYRSRRKAGEWIWVNTRGRVTERDSTGAPIRMIGTIHDVSDRKETEQRLQNALKDKEVLLREVHHRVKNNLAVIGSLFYLQSTHADDPATVALLQDGRDRVQSMALVHELLYQSNNFAAIDLAEYARSLASHLIRSYRTGTPIRVQETMKSLSLPVDTAIPCALILNELLTNALKHAFRDRAAGMLTLTLEPTASGLWQLSVTDDGVGMPAAPSDPRSLGTRLMQSLTKQLGGSLTFVERQPGTQATLTFSATAV